MSIVPNKLVTLILCTVILAGSVASAYEIDNFTDREILKQDSLKILNEKIDKILDRAVKETNKETKNYCSMAVLRQEILRWIRPDPTGQVEIWLELSDEINRTHNGIARSIYQDVTFVESPILKVVGIGRLILLANEVVGSDKIGHFFFQGLSYYDLVKEGKSLEKVLQEDHGEDGIWGLATGGIKSYADMAANYQGYRFWSQLTAGNNPYVKCDEKLGWHKVRSFDWSDYVSAAWDEGINCSVYRPAIQARVENYLQKRGMQCPLRPERCDEIAKLDHAEYFTSPQCAASHKSFLSGI